MADLSFSVTFFSLRIDIVGVSLHWNWNVHQTKGMFRAFLSNENLSWSFIGAKKMRKVNKRKRFSLGISKAYFNAYSLRMKKRKVILFIFCAVTFHVAMHRYRWTSFWWVSKRMNLVYTKWFCTQWDSKKDTYPFYYLSLFPFCTLLYYTKNLNPISILPFTEIMSTEIGLAMKIVLRHSHCNCTREQEKKKKTKKHGHFVCNALWKVLFEWFSLCAMAFFPDILLCYICNAAKLKRMHRLGLRLNITHEEEKKSGDVCTRAFACLSATSCLVEIFWNGNF